MDLLYTILSYDNIMNERSWVVVDYKGKYKVFATTDYKEALDLLNKLVSADKSNIHTYTIIVTDLNLGTAYTC